MSFGERLRELREERGLNQEDVAKLFHLSGQQIGNYERDIHFPRNEKMIKDLANYFNVSTDYLFGLTDIRNYNDVLGPFKFYKMLNEDHRHIINELIKYFRFKERHKTKHKTE